eukprot:COSAG05_NODE_1064_length_5991_cov_12.180414_6_plen_100_part_00
MSCNARRRQGLVLALCARALPGAKCGRRLQLRLLCSLALLPLGARTAAGLLLRVRRARRVRRRRVEVYHKSPYATTKHKKTENSCNARTCFVHGLYVFS